MGNWKDIFGQVKGLSKNPNAPPTKPELSQVLTIATFVAICRTRKSPENNDTIFESYRLIALFTKALTSAARPHTSLTLVVAESRPVHARFLTRPSTWMA
ncbi:MAG: hypothetical protein ACFCD0_18030 [Gemmataceae bacterium]